MNAENAKCHDSLCMGGFAARRGAPTAVVNGPAARVSTPVCRVKPVVRKILDVLMVFMIWGLPFCALPQAEVSPFF